MPPQDAKSRPLPCWIKQRSTQNGLQNAPKYAIRDTKNLKQIVRRGHCPFPRPSLNGESVPLPIIHPTLAPSALNVPPKSKSWIRGCSPMSDRILLWRWNWRTFVRLFLSDSCASCSLSATLPVNRKLQQVQIDITDAAIIATGYRRVAWIDFEHFVGVFASAYGQHSSPTHNWTTDKLATFAGCNSNKIILFFRGTYMHTAHRGDWKRGSGNERRYSHP